MSSEVARVLREAADLIEPPGRWTQGHMARDAAGYPVPSDSPDAVCWCVYGSVIRAGAVDAREGVAVNNAAVREIRREVGEHLIGMWNDDPQRQQAEVVAALRAAADEAERSDA